MREVGVTTRQPYYGGGEQRMKGKQFAPFGGVDQQTKKKVFLYVCECVVWYISV